MNFEHPDDADLIDVEAISKPEQQTVTLRLGPGDEPREQPLPEALDAAAMEIVDLQDNVDQLESQIEQREAVIEGQLQSIAELESQIEDLTATVEQTQSQLAEYQSELSAVTNAVDQLEKLEETVESVQEEIDSVDQTATEAMDRTTNQASSLCVIDAALFDEEYGCPSCEAGTISQIGPLTPGASCDSCGFKKVLSI
jgi:ABC-type transporter Mla subunit MlaD